MQMELGNQVGIPSIILAKGSLDLCFLNSKSGHSLDTSQAVSGYFLQLKAAVPGAICSSPLQACTPMAWAFLLGFGSWLSGPPDIYIVSFLPVGQSILVSQISLCICWFSLSHGWVMKHTLLGPDLFAIFFSPL